MTIVLYGIPHSLYTGKARSYLIKAGIPHQEQTPITPHYNNEVLPKAGGRRGFPTLELSNGDVIRDGTAIIDHFEGESGSTFSPSGFKQNFVSRLLDVIGMEGLLRPAMHYRWNYPENLPLLTHHFRMVFPPGDIREEMTEKAMNAMRFAGQNFGAIPETLPLVEELYLELVTKLREHFASYPYFLGFKPSIGDFGMIAPLFAHLGRDPAPLKIMQEQAVELLRWVERMNRPGFDQPEFVGQGEEYLENDEIPGTLIEVLKVIAEDFMPETRAAAEFINQWLAGQNEMTPGTTAERAVGAAEFQVRGQTIKAIAQPFRFYLSQRLFAIYDEASDAQRGELDDLLASVGMSDLMNLRLTRQIGRQDNLEIWL